MILTLAGIKLNNRISFLVITISICIVYSLIYWSYGTNENFHIMDSNKSQLTFLDALYFGFTTHITLGYGDISPKSAIVRLISISHTIVIMVSIAFASLV